MANVGVVSKGIIVPMDFLWETDETVGNGVSKYPKLVRMFLDVLQYFKIFEIVENYSRIFLKVREGL